MPQNPELLKSQLLSEIYEQPQAIRRMLENESERVAWISQQLSSEAVFVHPGGGARHV